MSEKRNLVPTWKVKVGRSDVDNATFKGTLRRVTVNDPINAVGKAVLEFEASFGGENRKELLKESEFELGNKVEIGLGYKDNVKKVFEGFITSFESSYTTTKKIVRVVCSNILYKTLNGKKARTFEKKCCSDILKEILREHGIDNDVEEIKIEKEYVSQEDKTDFEYILSTAQKFGMNLSCKESKVYIATDLDKKIKDGNKETKGDKISLEFGHNLISFKGREDVENQISRCTFVGTNCAKNERIKGAAAANDIPLQIGKESLESRVSGEWTSIFKNDTLQSNEEAKTLAKAVLQNVSMNYQRAEAQSEGENRIFPGKRIVIKAVDSRFSGTWLVERVVHDCAKVQGGFTTTVHLKRNKSGDDNDSASDRSVSAIEQERVASEEVEGEKEDRTKEVSYDRPSHFRKGVRDKVWESAKNEDGNVIDPVSKKVMKKTDKWDMGHKPGYEFRKHQESARKRKISRKQFLDEYNNPEHYRPELPKSNRSHKGENLTNEYFGD